MRGQPLNSRDLDVRISVTWDPHGKGWDVVARRGNRALSGKADTSVPIESAADLRALVLAVVQALEQRLF